jgi:hypothetical protein
MGTKRGLQMIFGRPVARTRDNVIQILERALETGGDSACDDFVSIKISDPELESARLKCLDVVLAPEDIFQKTLRALIAELRCV